MHVVLLRLIVTAAGSQKGADVGDVDFLDSKRSDDIVGVYGLQKGYLVDNLNFIGYRRWDEILEAGG